MRNKVATLLPALPSGLSKMFGPAWVIPALKIGAVAFVVGFLIHKGMKIERGRWERAIAAANAKVAENDRQWTARMATKDAEMAQAVADAMAVSNGLEACKLTQDQIKKANRIR